MQDYQVILEQLLSIINEPTSNLTVAALIAAFFTLALLIILLALTLYLLPKHPPATSRSEPGPAKSSPTEHSRARKRPSSRERRTRIVIASGLALLTFVSTWYVTGTVQYCGTSCHNEDGVVIGIRDTPHADISCIACHESGTVMGVPADIADRARYIYANLLEAIREESPAITGLGDRCLKCHETILEEVAEMEDTGIRVSHAEPLAAGMACEDCHTTSAHSASVTTGMQPCIECHDGVQADSECSLCHSKPPSDTAKRGSTGPTVSLGPVDDCGGCHSQTSCDTCHGIRMPHSGTFIQYAHAKEAAFANKAVCFEQCHAPTDCNKCHMGTFSVREVNGHPESWRQQHAVGGSGYCSCHQTKMPEQLQDQYFCEVCH